MRSDQIARQVFDEAAIRGVLHRGGGGLPTKQRRIVKWLTKRLVTSLVVLAFIAVAVVIGPLPSRPVELPFSGDALLLVIVAAWALRGGPGAFIAVAFSLVLCVTMLGATHLGWLIKHGAIMGGIATALAWGHWQPLVPPRRPRWRPHSLRLSPREPQGPNSTGPLAAALPASRRDRREPIPEFHHSAPNLVDD